MAKLIFISMEGGIDINGATTNASPTSRSGKNITVSVSYKDGQGASESVQSVPTSVVANIDDPHTGLIEVSGYLISGQTLSITNTVSDIDGKNNESYLWERSLDGGKTWLSIDGASNELHSSKRIGGQSFGKASHQEDGAAGAIRSIYSKPHLVF